jgi:hypothetical protein
MPTGYTPPAGNAVVLNFTGAYTPPAGNVVVLNFINPLIFTADAGTYALSGSPASLKYGRILRAYDNLILNGTFSADTSHWTVDGADTTFTSVNGKGVLTLGPAAAGGYAWQSISVVPGQRYTLSARLRPTNAYVLSASPGSYAVTGTAAALTHGSGGGTRDGRSASTATSTSSTIPAPHRRPGRGSYRRSA